MDNEKIIPLCEPHLDGNESTYLKECIDSTWVSSSGFFLDQFEKKIEEFTGTKYAIACVNGTSALHISLKLADVEVGNEVLVPTLTFIAPINAVTYCGASPVFFDCDKFHNFDLDSLEKFLKEETYSRDSATYNKSTNKLIRAIILVHVWGNSLDIDRALKLGKDYNISIIEDASESLGSIYHGEKRKFHTGTGGLLGCLSFNGNKIITTGGGGAILTDNADIARRAKYLVSQAKDDPIEYLHNEVGYNYRLTNIQASLGLAQIEKIPEKIQKKREIHSFYKKHIDSDKGRAILEAPSYSLSNQWLNVVQLNSDMHDNWRALFKHLKDRGIETRPVWSLNHKQRALRDYQKYFITKAESVVQYSLCLPSSVGLNENDLLRVCNAVNSYG